MLASTPHRHPSPQEHPCAANGDTITPASHAPTPVLVPDAGDQELVTTASRRLRHGADFLDAVHFMLKAKIHPKANQTTLRLAEVFAQRMRHSSQGHFPFAVDATAHALGLSRRAVLYHARYLRELGLLAYVQHGSKTNALRTRRGAHYRRGDGYRGTATLFAAVAPRVWDAARGRRIAGTGYHARVIGYTDAGRRRAIIAARHKARHRPTGSTSCTPSVVGPPHHRQVQAVGGKKDTSRTRARSRTTPTPLRTDHISPRACAHAIALAEHLQREVWWLHRTCARRLAYALRPLITRGWTAPSLAAELQSWGVPGHLRDAAAYIHHELARRQQGGILPGPTPPLADACADEEGHRYTAMLERRAARSAPVWQRYTDELRPALRRQLAALRETRHRPQVRHRPSRPMLREPEDAFAGALPERLEGRAAVREAYRARAVGRPVHASPAPAEHTQGWLERMRDQRAAERAFAVLRAELENWQHDRGGSDDTAHHRGGYHHAGLRPCSPPHFPTGRS